MKRSSPRVLARDAGVSGSLRSRRREPDEAARSHPLGLMEKEQRVLHLIGEGAGNRRIADVLARSQRTVEHHVSSVLAKRGVNDRMGAMSCVHREPWLLSKPEY